MPAWTATIHSVGTLPIYALVSVFISGFLGPFVGCLTVAEVGLTGLHEFVQDADAFVTRLGPVITNRDQVDDVADGDLLVEILWVIPVQQRNVPLSLVLSRGCAMPRR